MGDGAAILFATARLTVRRIAPADEDELLAILGDPEAARYYGTGRPWDRAAVARLLATYPFDDPRLVSEPGLARDTASGAIVGYGGVGYFQRPGSTAELFFILRRDAWGRGLATELALGAIAAAFRHPAVGAIDATVHPENRVSARVLEKCGLRLVGALPERDRLLYRIARGPHVDA